VSATAELLSTVLADHRIDDCDFLMICDQLYRHGKLGLDDAKWLVELYCQAQERCPAFDELFFRVLEEIFLADGEIQPSEQFYLLKMLYSDRIITEREKEFLHTLLQKAQHTSPEFEELCREAFRADPTDWDVGGR
jgi:hypothetical protein